jgi:hypothetical protein
MFPIEDELNLHDSDIVAWRDGLRAMRQLGLHGVGGVPRAWLQEQELGYTLTPMRQQRVPFLHWQQTMAGARKPFNVTSWAKLAAGSEWADGFAPGALSTVCPADEPGAQLPSALPPVRNSSAAEYRWVKYLVAQGLHPTDFGVANWSAVVPNVTAGYAPGASVANRRLRYWSVRHVAWDSSSYLGSVTRAIEAATGGPGAAPPKAFVNWNNFGGHLFYPCENDGAVGGGGGWLNNDWFEHARLRGGTLLWTEDWIDDGMAYYWSYYAALMGGATRLAAPHGGTADFGGYIVPRTSGYNAGPIDGALQRKVIALVGNGAKALKYFQFGPEYNFPGNCYSDSRYLPAILAEMRQAHSLIGRAEDILWPARKVPSAVAILAHRSSEIWDPVGTTKWENQQQDAMAYQADQFGLYLALAVHGGVPTDFVDEDALRNATVMAGYRVLFIAEPNVPTAAAVAVASWVRQGGRLVLSGGAAAYDEYNTSSSTLGAELTGARLSAVTRLLLKGSPFNPGALPAAGEILLPDSSSVGATSANPVAIATKNEPCTHACTQFLAYGTNTTFETLDRGDRGDGGGVPSGGGGGGGTVLATFARTKAAAALQSLVGEGVVTQFAFQPGLSYLINASEYATIPNPRTQLPSAVRQLLVGLTSDVYRPPVRVGLHSTGGGQDAGPAVGMETPLLTSARGAVVTMLNWGGDAALGAELRVDVDLPVAVFGSPPRVGRVFSARTGANLTFSVQSAGISVATWAAHADFVVITPETS